MGEAYFALGDYSKARQSFEDAIELSQELGYEGSNPASYRTHLALLEIAMGRYAEAEAQLEQARSFQEREGHPKEIAGFWSVYARLYERTGRRDQALDAIDKGIALLRETGDQFETVELLVQKASLLLADGKTEGAESVLREALQNRQKQSIAPVNFEAELLSARILHAKGKSKEANQRLQDLHKTRGTDAQHAALHYLLWQVNRKEEYARVAHDLYERLFRKTPNVEYRERLSELQTAREKQKNAQV